MRMKQRKQKGFTLIELIIVIVIVAILAAVAIPKYLDLQNDARLAATQGMAGALGSASAANYAIRSGFPTKGVAVTSCGTVQNTLQGGLDSNYTVAGTWDASPGATSTCTVTYGTTSTTATFVGHHIT